MYRRRFNAALVHVTEYMAKYDHGSLYLKTETTKRSVTGCCIAEGTTLRRLLSATAAKTGAKATRLDPSGEATETRAEGRSPSVPVRLSATIGSSALICYFAPFA